MRVTDIFKWAGVLAVLFFGVFRAQAQSSLPQAAKDRVWLAARYDGTHVVVYFGAVRFNEEFPKDARTMAPVAAQELFLPPLEIAAAQVASLPMGSGVERFAIGDHYDLLLDNGHAASVALTTIVAAQGDEYTGNDSYIGALATVAPSDLPYFTRDYYAVRRRGAMTFAKVPSKGRRTFASLSKVSTSVRTAAEIDGSLRGWLKRTGLPMKGLDPDLFPPVVDRLQAFTTSGGSRRYFVSSLQEAPTECARLRVWLKSTPVVEALAADSQACDAELKSVPAPIVLDVLEIGGGRTGLVVDIAGFDGRSLHLLEYVDGLTFDQMQILWAIDAGE